MHVAPAGDRRRVRILAQVEDLEEPFPYLELSLLDPENDVLARTLVMGVMEPQTQMTLHVRTLIAEDDSRTYRARGRLFFGSDTQEEEIYSIIEADFVFPG